MITPARSMPRYPHAAIVLAAGASRRLGTPKALLQHQGATLIKRTTQLLLATQPQCCVVVTGHTHAAICDELAALPVSVVHCAEWAQGMSASLRVALAALPESIAGALVTPCDLPALSLTHLQALLHTWQHSPTPNAQAVATAYQHTVGAPALLPRSGFNELMQTQGDRGAREWLRKQANLLTVVDESLAEDVDDAAALQRLKP